MNAGYAEGLVSIITNTLLFALKMFAGIVTGSVALIADAWHTLSDSLSSFVVIAATKLASRKPDKDHPFGHGRWEQIGAIFIGFILAIVAAYFLNDSIGRLREHTSANFGTIAIVVTIISIVVKEGLAQYAFYLGRRDNNVSVKADGWHHRSDALSSVVVLAGIFCSKYFWWIDGALGIIIALMLFYATYEIIKESITKLLGEEPSDELINKITNLASTTYNGNLQLHHFHIHNYVTHQELTFHIKLDGNMSLKESHRIATLIEEKIKKEFNIEATIHTEPLDFSHDAD